MIALVDLTRDGNAELVAQFRRRFFCYRNVPSAYEYRRDRWYERIQPGGDATLDAAQVSFGSRDVLRARKQERHVDWHAGKYRFLNRGEAFRGPRNLDVQIGASRASVE